MKIKSLLLAITTLLPCHIFSQDSLDVFSSASLQELVVSGNRWYQYKDLLSVKINNITFEEGNRYNPQTAADLLGLSGEVFIQKSQYGGGSPMIRGFATNRLLYSVDGVRMNTAIFRAGNLQNVISLDPFMISNTEVLFGPGSVNYGSDAIGGVMVFNTLQPQFSASNEPQVFGSATVRTASASAEKTAHIHAGIGFKRWAFLTGFTYSSFDDLKQGTHGPEKYIMPYIVIPEYGQKTVSDRIMANSDKRKQSPSGYSQHNFTQKVRYSPNNYWNFEYAFHLSETSEYSRYDRHQRMRDGKPRYAEWNYGPQKWMMNHLRAAHSKENAIYDIMRVDVALQRFEESRISRNLGKSNRETQSEKVDATSANIDFIKSIDNPSFVFSYGLEYVQNNVLSRGVVTDVITMKKSPMAARYPKAHWYSYAGYFNAAWFIRPDIDITAAIRYNHYRIDTDFSTAGYEVPFAHKQKSDAGNISGNIGVNWRPSGEWVIRANYARGFRAPNVDDMGKLFDSVDGCVTVPNPSLKAEYADNIEVGIAKNIGNRHNNLKLDLTAYYTHLNNAIVRRDYIFNGTPTLIFNGEECRVQALQNAAVARVWGIQAAVEGRLADWFYLKGNYNLQCGREELDNGETSPSRHAAPMFGRFALGFENERLCVEAFTAFQGECSAEDMPEEEKEKTEIYALDADGRAYSPSWYTLNLRTSYKVNDNIRLNATLENIADKRYRPYSCGISAPGRNLTVSVTYNL